MRILFITWDAPETSYLESLFLPIFAGLKAKGISTDVLQFRWATKALTAKTAEACQAQGIGYRAAPIWRTFGGAGAMVSASLGRIAIRKAIQHFKPDALMPRSLMPAWATLIAGADHLLPVVFDADGLAIDERVEFAGLSPTGVTYRVLRDIEAQMVRKSISTIVRSSQAADILLHRAGPPVTSARFHVVANGRDDGVFRPGNDAQRQTVRRELGIAETAPVIVYAGSVGQQYRFDQLSGFARTVLDRRPDARLLVLTNAPDQAKASLAQSDPKVVQASLVLTVQPLDVPRYLACADIGTAFRDSSFSMKAVAPIKLAEYLLCGLPVVGTSDIGDTRDAILAGLFFDEAQGLDVAAEWFIDRVLPYRLEFRERARHIGITNFSLSRSVQGYYDALEPLRSLD